MSEAEGILVRTERNGLIGYPLTSTNTAITISFRRVSRGEGKNRICLQ
jgi:hypothetical protein